MFMTFCFGLRWAWTPVGHIRPDRQ